MLCDGFSPELKDDVSAVSRFIATKMYHGVKIGESENTCSYDLLGGGRVCFPYRVYYLDDVKEDTLSSLPWRQRMIYHAVFTRSCDGLVREKHLNYILEGSYPDWVFPYLIKLSDEYVIEILNAIYKKLKGQDTEKIKAFCKLNLQSFLQSHARMTSYWNEYARGIVLSSETILGNACLRSVMDISAVWKRNG